MNNESVKAAGQQREVFVEPVCELVEFNFEDILALNESSGAELPPDVIEE